ADRFHLLAHEVAVLLLLRAGLDVLADTLAHLELSQAVALELPRQRQALDDVQRLQDLDLLGEGQVRRVAGRVRQRADVGDGPDEGAHAAVVAAQLEDLVDAGAVLLLERGAARTRLDDARTLLDVDAQLASAV